MLWLIVQLCCAIFITACNPSIHGLDRFGYNFPLPLVPQHFLTLWHFLDALPGNFTYGVEVRHPDFFAKGEAERLADPILFVLIRLPQFHPIMDEVT